MKTMGDVLVVVVGLLCLCCIGGIPCGLGYFDPTAPSVRPQPLHLGSFNIKDFGATKAGRSSVMNVLAGTAIRYDVIFVQELSQDPTNECGPNTASAICDFRDLVNQKGASLGRHYEFNVSVRVGGAGAEQYFAFYDTEKVTVEYNLIYPDTGDLFVRKPQMIGFRIRSWSDHILWGVNIHTSPDFAAEEVLALATVAEYLVQMYNAYYVYIGDFNADGTYFSDSDWPPFYSKLYNISTGYDVFSECPDKEWKGLVSDGMDSMVLTSFTYDRMVVSPPLYALYETGSIKVFHFDNVTEGGFEMQPLYDQGCGEGWYSGCSDPVEDVARVVSDHYPIEAVFGIQSDASRVVVFVVLILLLGSL